MFEDMQPGLIQTMPQGAGDLSREAVFAVPGLADGRNYPPVREMPGRLAGQFGGQTGPKEAG